MRSRTAPICARPVSPRATRPRSRHGQAGTSLLEALIGVLILSVGLLGVAALQVTALRQAHASHQHTNAVTQSYAILDAMRANPEGVAKGDYASASVAPLCEPPPDLPTNTLARRDLRHWMQSLDALLGDPAQACGQVRCGEGQCKVEITWRGAAEPGQSPRETVEIAGHL